MFVDDTKMFCVIRNSDDYKALQDDFNALYEWSFTWQMKFILIIGV